jgi:hypothetical protein
MNRSLLVLCAVLSATSLTHARPATKLERSYARALSLELRLEPRSAEGIGSKQGGARGVRVRFPKLRVARLHFPTLRRAQAFARKRRARSYRHQRVEVRKREVVVILGARLADEEFSKRARRAAWSCVVGAPSPVARSKKAKGAHPSRNSGPRPATGGLADLRGEWLTVGRGTVVFSRRREDADGDTYVVELRGFRDPARYRAVFDGKTLSLFQGKKAALLFVRRRGAALRFFLAGRWVGTLPRGALMFWNAAEEAGD